MGRSQKRVTPWVKSFALWDRHCHWSIWAFLEFRTLVEMETNPFQPFCLIFCDCLPTVHSADGDVLAAGKGAALTPLEGLPAAHFTWAGRVTFCEWLQNVFSAGQHLSALSPYGSLYTIAFIEKNRRVQKKWNEVMACSPKAERMLEWKRRACYSWAASTVVRLSPSGRQPRALLFGMEMTGVWAAACPVFASCHSLRLSTVLPFICFLFLGNKIFSQIRPPVLKVIVGTEARWWCEYPSVIRWGFGRKFPAVGWFLFHRYRLSCCSTWPQSIILRQESRVVKNRLEIVSLNYLLGDSVPAVLPLWVTTSVKWK